MYRRVDKIDIEIQVKQIKEIDENFIYNEEYEYYIVVEDKKIIGYAVLNIKNKDAILVNMFIKKEKRHNDYGMNFIKYLERIKGKDGIERLLVKDTSDIEFLHKAGFKKDNHGYFYDKIYKRKQRFYENSKVIIFSIIGNIILSITKIFFGIRGNSRALYSDGLNSLSDVATSTGMYIGNWYSNQPADESHPYGHEKIESVIANILGLFMILIAFELVRGSLGMLYGIVMGAPISTPSLNTILWGGISAIVKYAMYYYKLKTGVKTGNQSLIADAKDSRNDIFTSLGAVMGIILGVYVNPIFDVLLSIPIGVIIFKEGIGVIWENSNLILDKQDREQIDEIKEFINNEAGIKNTHNIKTRVSGNKIFLSLHMRVPKDKTVEEAHHMSHELEDKLINNFENLTEVIIHIEPIM